MSSLGIDAVKEPARRSSPLATSSTLEHVVGTLARNSPHRASLVSADGQVITAQELLIQIRRTAVALRSMGLSPQDRVAVVMPNGIALAAAFLSVACSAACAPLNPSLSADEFEFYLADLQPKLLITTGRCAPAVELVAARLDIPILSAPANGPIPDPITLCNEIAGVSHADTSPSPDNVALYLYTSGTTARPKLVPLRHRNLLTSAANMASFLGLTESDRCLNLMPLFHIHGLMGGLLAPLAAGGSVVCPPDLRPGVFLRWMEATRPTWYTAVPTMHRLVVAEAKDHRALVARSALRFVRSSSAPLPAALCEEIEQVFGCPVLEAYSMTEAAHQVTCNPTGEGRQRRGTVGIPAGPEVRIMDASGQFLPNGEEGEIVIRGPSVMSGYEANPGANSTAFRDGWFRTGDQGRFDPDGYLILTGRLKEQINRGGEKIAPLELDRTLLGHPDVIDAAAFSFPHPTLGEEIGAAVVLRPGATIDATALQQFLRERVAPFKIPRRIVLVDKIPKSATGKVQRGKLHEQLGVTVTRSDGPVPPDSPCPGPLEADLLRLWRDLLKSEYIGRDDDFFESGGDSLLAVEMLLAVEKLVGHEVSPSILLDHSTVSRLSRALAGVPASVSRPLITLQGGTARPPVFFFHGDYEGGYYARRMARLIDPEQPFVSIAPHGLDRQPVPGSIEEMAAERLKLLMDHTPRGPYLLGGYCNGGMVALETARLLADSGHRVDLVFLIDVPMLNLLPAFRKAMTRLTDLLGAIDPDWETNHPKLAWAVDSLWRQRSNIQVYRRDPTLLQPALSKLVRWAGLNVRGAAAKSTPRSDAAFRRELQMARIYNRLLRKYIPRSTDLPVIYFAAEQNGAVVHRLGPNTEVINVPGGHWGCITTHADVLAAHLRTRLNALRGREAPSAGTSVG